MVILPNALATALVVYRRPDRLWLLQEYVWQTMDFAPELPRVRKFLDFWRNKLDGPIVSVTVALADPISHFRHGELIHFE